MNKLNVLCSFEYLDEHLVRKLEEHQNEINLIVDSGAFTAFTQNKQINLSEYTKFIFDLKKRINKFYFVQLDVIFDPKKTRENFQKQLDAGLDPCPVFTRGDDPDYFFELVENGHYVFVGGAQRGEGSKNYAKFLLERSKNKKIHYLAFTNQKFIRAYSPYSVDSSSWSRCCRFGFLELYEGFGKLIKLEKKELKQRIPNKIITLMRNLGMTNKQIEFLKSDECWGSNWKYELMKIDIDEPTRTYAPYISILSHILQATELQKHFKTKTHFAVTSWREFMLIYTAWNELKEKKIIDINE